MSNYNSNKNSRIQTRVDRTGKLRTETVRRDAGSFDVAISTDTRNNSTRVFIDSFGRSRADGENFFMGADLELSGHQARTLYRALKKHLKAQGKSVR